MGVLSLSLSSPASLSLIINYPDYFRQNIRQTYLLLDTVLPLLLMEF